MADTGIIPPFQFRLSFRAAVWDGCFGNKRQSFWLVEWIVRSLPSTRKAILLPLPLLLLPVLLEATFCHQRQHHLLPPCQPANTISCILSHVFCIPETLTGQSSFPLFSSTDSLTLNHVHSSMYLYL